MANTAQNIVLYPSSDIPFNKLVLTQYNMRALLDPESVETGMLKFPAADHLFQALTPLAKQKPL